MWHCEEAADRHWIYPIENNSRINADARSHHYKPTSEHCQNDAKPITVLCNCCCGQCMEYGRHKNERTRRRRRSAENMTSLFIVVRLCVPVHIHSFVRVYSSNILYAFFSLVRCCETCAFVWVILAQAFRSINGFTCVRTMSFCVRVRVCVSDVMVRICLFLVWFVYHTFIVFIFGRLSGSYAWSSNLLCNSKMKKQIIVQRFFECFGCEWSQSHQEFLVF